MKKKLTKLLAVILVLSLCFSLFAAVSWAAEDDEEEEIDDPPHKHDQNLGPFAAKGPGYNCVVNPVYYNYYYCEGCYKESGAAVETGVVGPLYDGPKNHNMQNHYVQPTCTGKGGNYSSCTECGWTQVLAEMPALGHNYTTTETPSTCEVAGYYTHTCTRCGTSDREPIAPLGHEWGIKTLPQLGVDYEACIRDGCGKINPNSSTGSNVAITEAQRAPIGREQVICTYAGEPLSICAYAVTNPPLACQVIMASDEENDMACVFEKDMNTGILLDPEEDKFAKVLIEDDSGYNILTGGEPGMETGIITVYEFKGGTNYDPLCNVILEDGEQAVIASVEDGVITTERGTTFELSPEKIECMEVYPGDDAFCLDGREMHTVKVKYGPTIPRITLSTSRVSLCQRLNHPVAK